MATQVEIYDERELDPNTLKPEADAEAVALIEELGLDAQKHEDGQRIAYPVPTADQVFIIQVLFPQMTHLKSYDAGSIPLRVLKEIRSYKAENPNHRLIVLHSTPAQVKDPFLMAYCGSYEWEATQKGIIPKLRMIARWGDALEPWPELMNKAKTIMAGRATDTLDLLIRKATAMRESVKSTGCWPSSSLPKLDNIPEGW